MRNMKKVPSPIGRVTTKDRSAMYDAFCKNENGSVIVVEAKNIGPRINNLRETAYDIIMEKIQKTPHYRSYFHIIMKERAKANKATVRNPFLLFKAAKVSLKKVAQEGGDDYEYSLALFEKLTQTGTKKVLAEVVEMILD